jgi:hypothetical protein
MNDALKRQLDQLLAKAEEWQPDQLLARAEEEEDKRAIEFLERVAHMELPAASPAG